MRLYIRFILPPVIYLVAFLQMTPKKTWYDPDTYWHIELGKTMVEQKRFICEAIYSFNPSLPYVPHEWGFQWIVGILYELGSWPAVHLLTVVCLGLLMWGLYELAKVSRKEMGMEEIHPFVILLIPAFTLLIYITYFKVRPQMVSTPIILWFLVYLRLFQMKADVKTVGKLGFLSLLLSNVHGGVWPVIAVFYGMALIESLWNKKSTKLHVWGLPLLLMGGICNVGGWNTLFYFRTIGNSGFTSFISEWQPIHFAQDKVFFVILLIFILSALSSIHRQIFRLLFMIGILYLGVSSYKEHLYMMLFLLYFLAVAIEKVRWLNEFKQLTWLGKSSYFNVMVSIGLVLELAMGFISTYEEPNESYPVEEMNYILSKHSDGRPKVLSTYASSGYVMFRGGDTLADGRMDPFITPASKGIHDWTAFERSVYAYESAEIINIIQYDKPDFVIVPKPKQEKENTGWSLDDIAQDSIHKALGEPDYVGSFGEVYQIKR